MDGLDKALMGAQSTSLFDAVLKARRSPGPVEPPSQLIVPEPIAQPVPPWWSCLKRGQRILYAPRDLGTWHLGRIWEVYPNGEKISILFDDEPKLPKFVAVDDCWI